MGVKGSSQESLAVQGSQGASRDVLRITKESRGVLGVTTYTK